MRAREETILDDNFINQLKLDLKNDGLEVLADLLAPSGSLPSPEVEAVDFRTRFFSESDTREGGAGASSIRR